MKSKILHLLVMICALTGVRVVNAQGFIGNGSTTDIVGVTSTGTNAVRVGIGTAAPSVTLDVFAPSNLGLKFQNLPNSSTSDVLYYNSSTGTVTYGAAPTGTVSTIEYDGGIGTVTINGTISSTLKAWLLTGSTTTGTSYLGTFNNDDIRICTNNASTSFAATKQKMSIGSDANNGFVQIAWDGTNAPPTPLNKFLLQTGTVSATPYAAITGFPIVPSDIGFYAYTNNQAGGSNNIGIVSVADFAGPLNAGFVSLVSNSTQDNTGFFGMVTSVASGVSNSGANVEVMGDDASNSGFSANVSGDNSNNLGAGLRVSGVTAQTNRGLDIEVQQSTAQNDGASIIVTGDGSQNTGIWMNVTDANAGPGSSGINMNLNCATTTNDNYGFNANVTGSTQRNVGVTASSNGNGGFQNIGVMGSSFGTNTDNYGTEGFAQDAANNYGIAGYINGVNNAGNNCVGVIGRVSIGSEGANNYGVWGYLGGITPTGGNSYYAVAGVQAGAGSGSSTTISTGPLPNTWAGYFQGDVYCSDTYFTSDESLKDNIKDYKGALKQLEALPVKRYTFKTKENPFMSLPQGERVGIMAGDLKKVFPNLVKSTKSIPQDKSKEQVEFEAVNYDALIPVLVQAVKELNTKTDLATAQNSLADVVRNQQAEIEQLHNELKDLRDMLNNLCSTGCAALTRPVNNPEVVLSQSVPNPTTGTAIIDYTINATFNTAVISVASLDGNILKEFKITQPGKGKVVFEGQRHAQGTYTYSVIVDGKVYDTKTFVIARN